MTSVSTTVAAYATTHTSDANWAEEAESETARYIGIGVLVVHKTLRSIPAIQNLWAQETPAWYRYIDQARYDAIVDAAAEMARNAEENAAIMDWQRYLHVPMQAYVDELVDARNDIETQRLWMRGRVNFILGDTVRAACCLVCSSLTMASAIYSLINNPNDPWDIKAWEVAQIAVDSLGLLTNGWVFSSRVAGRFGIELAVAECVPVLGEIFTIAGAAVAVVLIIVQSSRLSPEQVWVRDVGSKMLKTVKAPPSDWLAEHPLPSDVQ